MSQRYAIVIGAGGAIGRATLQHFLAEQPELQLIAISRQPDSALVAEHDSRLQWLQSDYSEESIARIGKQLEEQQDLRGALRYVVIATGQLHGEGLKPEKRLNDLAVDTLTTAFRINSVVPMLWLKALRPLLTAKDPCRIAVLSARIGSIDDNQRGGWYGYRASKAALNMLVRNAAIEMGRVARRTEFVLFHPGTTDSPLSEPFQKSVPEGKLFTPEFVANCLWQQLSRDDLEGNIHYLDWQGESVAW